MIGNYVADQTEVIIDRLRPHIEHQLKELIKNLKPHIEDQANKTIDQIKPHMESEVKRIIEALQPYIKEKIKDLKPFIQEQSNNTIKALEPVILEKQDRIELILNQKLDNIIDIKNKQISEEIIENIKIEIQSLFEEELKTIINEVKIIIDDKSQEIDNKIQEIDDKIQEIVKQQILGFVKQQFLEINNKLYFIDFCIFKEKLNQLYKQRKDNQNKINMNKLNQELEIFLIPLIKSSDNLRNIVIIINDFKKEINKLNISIDNSFKLLEEPIKEFFNQSRMIGELLHNISKNTLDNNSKIELGLIEINNINYNSVIIQELIAGNDININEKLDVKTIKKYNLENHYTQNHTYNGYIGTVIGKLEGDIAIRNDSIHENQLYI